MINRNYQSPQKFLKKKKRNLSNDDLSRTTTPKTRKNSKKQSKNLKKINDRLLSAFIQNDEFLKNYSEIENCTIVKPNIQQMANPIDYFAGLFNEKKPSTGIIKIIPPVEWKEYNKLQFNLFDKQFLKDGKIEIRKQNLRKLCKAKKFISKSNDTLNDYIQFAQEFEKKNLNPCLKKQELEYIENTYWNECNNHANNKESLEVKYAADLPLSLFISQENLDEIVANYKDSHLWTLLTLNKHKGSLFQFIEKKEQISGITLPWIYFGMLYSTFCWHTEDLHLFSLNYMHKGKPKIWYSVNHQDKEKMDNFIKNKFKNQLKIEPDLIHNLTVHIDPLELIESGIKVYKTIQYPGEIILTLPKGYHQGFSTGFNVSEAVNFSCSKWIDFGKQAIDEYRKTQNKLPVFPLEWLLMNVKLKFNIINFNKNDDRLFVENFTIKLIKDELNKRENIQKILSKTKYNYKFLTIRKNRNFEEYECDLCPTFGYFSVYICQICNYVSCLDHFPNCQSNCDSKEFCIYYRYSNKELKRFLKGL